MKDDQSDLWPPGPPWWFWVGSPLLCAIILWGVYP